MADQWRELASDLYVRSRRLLSSQRFERRAKERAGDADTPLNRAMVVEARRTTVDATAELIKAQNAFEAQAIKSRTGG